MFCVLLCSLSEYDTKFRSGCKKNGMPSKLVTLPLCEMSIFNCTFDMNYFKYTNKENPNSQGKMCEGTYDTQSY